jgi:cysteine synthase
MGVAHILRPINPSTRVIVLEPASAPMISKGFSGTHHVEGIGIGLIPPLLDKSFYDEARGIDETEARQRHGAWQGRKASLPAHPRA